MCKFEYLQNCACSGSWLLEYGVGACLCRLSSWECKHHFTEVGYGGLIHLIVLEDMNGFGNQLVFSKENILNSRNGIVCCNFSANFMKCECVEDGNSCNLIFLGSELYINNDEYQKGDCSDNCSLFIELEGREIIKKFITIRDIYGWERNPSNKKMKGGNKNGIESF